MASTFHGGIAFHLPNGDREVRSLGNKRLKLTYRLDECTLELGDSVAGGDLLGKYGTRPIRASLSGQVSELAALDGGIRLTVEDDGKDHLTQALPFGKKTGKTLADATSDELLTQIGESGIAEQSGELLIDHLKRALSYAPGKLRLAAATCFDLDPLSATNISITEENAEAVAGGLTILLRILKVKDGAMLCDSRYKESIKAAREALADSTLISIEITNNRYPQADPHLITRWLMDKELSSARATEDAGLFLIDAETCASLYHFFAVGLPKLSKRVSVFADGELCLYDLPYGLDLSNLSTLGISAAPDDDRVVCRGGMDGRALPETVDATLNSIALLPEIGFDMAQMLSSEEDTVDKKSGVDSFLSALSADRVDCISCGRCAQVCPMFLLPYDYLPKSRLQKWLSGSAKDGYACIGCGCCSYICPAGLPLRSAVLASSRKEGHDGN